jgi:hypothetical protein
MRVNSLRNSLVFYLTLATLGAGAAVAEHGDDEDGPRTIQVDCSHGKTLKNVFDKNDRGPLVVEFKGTCTEDVTIPGDDITLRGSDSTATVIGTVTVEGRSRVTLDSFTVRDTPVGSPITRIGDGVAVVSSQHIILTDLTVLNTGNIGMDLEGSTVDITDISVTHSRGIGIATALGSVVHAFGAITVTQATGIGMIVTDTAQIQLSPRSVTTSTDNQGTGLSVQLQGHIFMHGGSRLTVSRNPVGISVVDLGNFTYGGATIEVSNNLFLGVQVGEVADWTPVAGVVPNVTIVNNGGPGVSVSRTGFVRLRENTTITGNAGPGLIVDGSGVAVRGSVIQGNNGGHGDVFLSFGSRATFDGGNTFGSAVTCDGTSLIQGQFTCGAALTAAQAEALRVAAGPPAAAIEALPQP